LYQPRSVVNIFGNWLNGVDDRFEKHIRVGVIAVNWSLLLCGNDKVFNDKPISIL
jgi:putative heme degradation protein